MASESPASRRSRDNDENVQDVQPQPLSVQEEPRATRTEDVAVTMRDKSLPRITVETENNQGRNKGIQASNNDRSGKDGIFRSRTTRLQRLLKLYFYTAVKYNNHRCSFHFIYFVFMVLQIVKLTCITAQMFSFGNERGNFNNVVKRGHVTLKNLLLKGWDASWETPPYPPAHGDFALYDIKELKESINYAVEKLYNAEEDAIGFYKRPNFDSVKAEITYFDFGGFDTGPTDHGLTITTKTFNVHVRSNTNQTTNETIYTYDVDEDFQRNNLSEPVKRMLMFILFFNIESVRVYIDRKKARCLKIIGKIKFEDPDNNGQVTVSLDTTTERQICKDVGYDVPDVTIEAVSRSLIILVLLLSFVSLAYTFSCLVFGIFVYLKTKKYMELYFLRFFEPDRYKEIEQQQQQPSQSTKVYDEKQDLPLKEYLRFIKGWDFLVLVADITTIAGNLGLELRANEKWTVASLDNFTVLVGIGCLFAWIGLLRYFKFHYKFHLLFNTLYASFWDVLAYLACICVLFVGYMSFGYVVLGPYHIKFETPAATSQTLFSIVNGDEIYATFALLQTDQTGGELVPVIYQIYLGSFIAIFTIIVLNLLIALFTNAYDNVKKQYEEPDDVEEGPVEAALKQLLVSGENQDKRVTGSVMQLLQSDRHSLSVGEDNLRTQLLRIVAISKSKRTLVLKRPKTIKEFINADIEEITNSDEKETSMNHKCCCSVSCLFGCCENDEKEFFLQSTE